MMNNIIGHNSNIRLLDKVVRSEGFHHGFLFWGPENVGKNTIAQTFASKLVLRDVNDEWSADSKVDSDVYIIEPERILKKKKMVIRDISIDSIRDANYWIALAPDKKARVLIINDAHRMTKSAQNALLKTLEEPKDNRYIILVTNNSNDLLQTIQSRCFGLQFGNICADEMIKIYKDDKFLQDVSGKPGFLHSIHSDNNFREIVEYAREQLQSLSNKKMYERLILASELSKKDDEYLQTFFQVWIHRIWVAAHKTKKFDLLKFADEVESMLLKFRSTNVNKQLVLESLLINTR